MKKKNELTPGETVWLDLKLCTVPTAKYFRHYFPTKIIHKKNREYLPIQVNKVDENSVDCFIAPNMPHITFPYYMITVPGESKLSSFLSEQSTAIDKSKKSSPERSD